MQFLKSDEEVRRGVEESKRQYDRISEPLEQLESTLDKLEQGRSRLVYERNELCSIPEIEFLIMRLTEEEDPTIGDIQRVKEIDALMPEFDRAINHVQAQIDGINREIGLISGEITNWENERRERFKDARAIFLKQSAFGSGKPQALSLFMATARSLGMEPAAAEVARVGI